MPLKCTILLFEDICVDGRVDRQIKSLSPIYDITIIAFSSGDYKNELVSFINLGAVCELKDAYLKYIFNRLISVKPDLLVVNNIPAIIPALLTKLRFPKLKIIYDSHELIVPDKLTGVSIASRKSIALEKIMCKLATKIVTPNYERASLMMEYYNLKELPEIIPNHIEDTRSLAPDYRTNSDRKNTIGCIYQGVLKKGRFLELIVKSFKYVDKCTLTIVGFGPLEEEILKIIEDNNLQNKVNFMGKKRPSELLEVSKQSDFGLVTYDFSNMNNKYCASNKLSEYVLAGLPILSTPQESIKNDLLKFSIGDVFDIEDLKDKNEVEIAKAFDAFCDNFKLYSNNVKNCRGYFVFHPELYTDVYKV